MSLREIYYSEKYYDDYFEYRHVIVPKDMAKLIATKKSLMSESEWRAMGIQQSQGWIHYMYHKPEPHVVLFRRPKTN